MSERTSHFIETPVSKHKVEIRDWLTGGEKRSLTEKGGGEASALALVGTLVVSINGSSEKIMDQMDAMHGKDFDFILTELATVAENSSYQKKTS